MNKPEDIFLHAKANEATGCVEWVGTLWATGYGRFQLRNKSVKAHRVAYELRYAKLPADACVLHRCDNRKCINADHLFIGTRKDNNLDKTKKGRQTRGAEVNTAKITVEDVRLIRADARPSKQIASEFGISWGQVNKVRGMRAWNHV
jgi:hypothetical protein